MKRISTIVCCTVTYHLRSNINSMGDNIFTHVTTSSTTYFNDEWQNADCHMEDESSDEPHDDASQGYNDGDVTDFTNKFFQVYLLTIVGCVGLIGNVALIYMFARIQNQLKFHRLMLMMSVYDTCLIILGYLVFALPTLNEAYANSVLGYIAPTAFPLAKVALTGSVYSRAAVAFDRFLIICYPFFAVRHKWSARRYIIPILVFSVLYNLPRFFSLETVLCVNGKFERPSFSANQDQPTTNTSAFNMTDGKRECEYDDVVYIRPTALRRSPQYYDIYLFWIDLFVMILVPISFLVFLNVKILTSIRRKHRERMQSNCIDMALLPSVPASSHDIPIYKRRMSRQDVQRRKKRMSTTERMEQKLAKLGLIIVFIFIACHSVKLLPNIYEMINRLSDDGNFEDNWIKSFIHLSNFLIVLTSSINFYIYCFTHLNMGTKLKVLSQALFCSPCATRLSHSPSDQADGNNDNCA